MTRRLTPAFHMLTFRAVNRKGANSAFKVGKEVGSLDPDKLIT